MMTTTVSSTLAALLILLKFGSVGASWSYAQPARFPGLPPDGPKPNPDYMVDNERNTFNVAPDKGTQNGPVWKYSGSLENYLANLQKGYVVRGGFMNPHTLQINLTSNSQDYFTSSLPGMSNFASSSLVPGGLMTHTPQQITSSLEAASIFSSQEDFTLASTSHSRFSANSTRQMDLTPSLRGSFTSASPRGPTSTPMSGSQGNSTFTLRGNSSLSLPENTTSASRGTLTYGSHRTKNISSTMTSASVSQDSGSSMLQANLTSVSQSTTAPTSRGNQTMNLQSNTTSNNQANSTSHPTVISAFSQSQTLSNYWLPKLGPLGQAPLVSLSGYKIFRDVVADYGADSTGGSDASEAINAAVQDGNRCGQSCGNSFTQGAIIYFPPGNYTICSPIIQLYYTQFVGDPINPPTILGCPEFTGIALFDTDPYIPGGSGSEWFVNQNQFFRQIRNFIFELRFMPASTDDNDQPLVPTGIHWQVAQSTSLQNLKFLMTSDEDTTQVGIFMENGSGGFVSDLEFYGGAIGFRAGSQQYTARSLKFEGCVTAVQMVWDWGFTWQDITVDGGAIAFNITGNGGADGQGIGSISIIDSAFNNVPVGILTHEVPTSPNIVLDNLNVKNVGNIVQNDGGSTLLAGSTGNQHIALWMHGNIYLGGAGAQETGNVMLPQRPPGLLSGGSLYTRSRPQYENTDASGFLIATENGIANDGTGDQGPAINAFLLKAVNARGIAYFPAGIYQVGSTVFIPTGSVVQGSLWSQIQGSGFMFSDLNNPQVMVRVGNKGDVGTMEITEMLFSVKGPTAGAILMEWNVAASTQGAAAMWDSHFRVGGAQGSDLDAAACPKFGFNDQCIAASLMFHVTSQASGYFENVWAWVADHDNDDNVTESPDPLSNQVSVYGARGMLIESQGPSWFYGTSSEHSVLYNYQLHNAKDIYMGHIQTETPYYQPNPVAPQPFDAQTSFPADPIFEECDPESQTCAAAWGLRVVDSSNITIHGAGLYSFFQEFYQDCVETENCQERILEVTGSQRVVIFNLFTVATSNIAVGIDNTVIFQNGTQSGFSTEVAVWVPLPGLDNIDVIYVGTEIFSSPTVTGTGPVILVLPTSSLSTSSTISPGTYTTSVEYGHFETSTVSTQGGALVTIFSTTITTLTLTIPDITIGALPFFNVNITSGEISGGFVATPSVSVPDVTVSLPDGNGGSTARVLSLPPWPEITIGPPQNYPTASNSFGNTFHTPFKTTLSASDSTVTTISIPPTVSALTVTCPPQSVISFESPRILFETDCPEQTTFTLPFICPTSKVITFLAPSEGIFTVDCTLSLKAPAQTSDPGSPTSDPVDPTTTTSTTPFPIWATWPYFGIYPISTPVPSPTPTDIGVVIPCDLWFFSICIKFPTINVQGWHIRAPPGVYPGPIPPPGIEFPPGFTLKGKLPPWPKITILPGGQITFEQEPKDCETESASICSTTTFYSATSQGTRTLTTATSISATCATVYGCEITDSSTATKTTTATGCPATPTAAAPVGCPQDAFVYPANPMDVGEIPALLQEYASSYKVVGAPSMNYVAFYRVPLLDQQTMNSLQASPDVDGAYYYEEFYANVGYNSVDLEVDTTDVYQASPRSVDSMIESPYYSMRKRRSNSGSETEFNVSTSNSAGVPAIQETAYFELSQISVVQKQSWGARTHSNPLGKTRPLKFNFDYDESAGDGQYTYIINEHLVWETNSEFLPNPNPRIRHLGTTLSEPDEVGDDPPSPDSKDYYHGSLVASKIIGNKLGTCKKCNLAWFAYQRVPQGQPGYKYEYTEDVLDQLATALEDMKRRGTKGDSVINLSFTVGVEGSTTIALRALLRQLRLLENEGAVLVAAAGNRGDKGVRYINRYPPSFLNPQDQFIATTQTSDIDRNSGLVGRRVNMIVVGATVYDTYQSPISQYADWMTTFAPGYRVNGPNAPDGGIGEHRVGSTTLYSGTSLAAPLVAGVAAYFRGFKGLPNNWSEQLKDPGNVKRLIVLFHRRFLNRNAERPYYREQIRPIVWNAQVWSKTEKRSYSCLADYDTRQQWDEDRACPDIPEDLSKLELFGTGERTVKPCGMGGGGTAKRQSADDGDSCPLFLGDADGEFSVSFTSPPTSASPAPTCAAEAGCGGTLCTGFYCNPEPTGVSPDFYDPKDPAASNPVSTTNISPTSTSSTPAPTSARGALSVISQSGKESGDKFVEALAFPGSNDYCDQPPIPGFDYKVKGTTKLPANWEQSGWNYDDDWTSCYFGVQGSVGGEDPLARLQCDGMPSDVEWRCYYVGDDVESCASSSSYDFKELFQCRTN